MTYDLRQTVERAIAALRTLASDLEQEPAPGKDSHRREQRVADRLQGVAEALELAAQQERSGPAEELPGTPSVVSQDTPSQQQRHLDAMHQAAMRAHLRRTARPKPSHGPDAQR